MNCLTDQETLENLLKKLRIIPLFSGYSSDYLKRNIKVRLLPSHSNTTYKIHITGTSYILKSPKCDTKHFIDRKNELTNTRIAFHLGLAPKILWQGNDGAYLIHYLEDTQHLDYKDLHNPHIIKALAKKLLLLQKSTVPFKGDLHNTETIRKHLKQYYKHCSISVRNKLKQIYNKSLKALDNIEKFDLPAVPSHIDLTLENILIEKNTNERIWLIDWEYSAMASPFWDIATLCNNGEFNDKQANDFLKYFISLPSKKESELLVYYRILLSGISHCWQRAFQK